MVVKFTRLRWRFGLVLVLALAIAHAEDRGDAWSQARDSGKAELGVLWVASPGWAEPGPDGKPGGVSIELMRRFVQWLEESEGLQIKLHLLEEENWTNFYRRVRDGSGGLFGLGNVTITEARRSELKFSPPYARNVGVLITPDRIAEIDGPDALPVKLHGLRALAFADTLHEQRLRDLAASYWPDMAMDFTRSNGDILDQVAAGTHFAYIDGYHYLNAVAEGAALRRHPHFDAGGERFGVIMPLDNDWAPLLERFFAEAEGGLLASAWYRELFERHLGIETAELMRARPGD